MPVIQLPATALRLGAPVPFALRDASGHLLVARGSMVESEEVRQQLISRGIYVDEEDSRNFQRAMAGKLDSMVRSNALLGQIAQAQPDAAPGAGPAAAAPKRAIHDPVAAWHGVMQRTSTLLRDHSQPDFTGRLERIDRDLLELIAADPDASLLTLIHTTMTDSHQYSVHHALLVATVCELAAQHLPAWSEDTRTTLRRAALTMNIAMVALQDQLAVQDTPLSPPQRQLIKDHATAGATQLRGLGVTCPLWLGAVEQHHASPPGPLAALAQPLQLARLIQRADIFAARLSPRKKRDAMSAAAAAKAAYLDENGKPDEAGAAIIKALGIYPPGSYVQLASNEVAVVLRRGSRANEPLVASVISRSGTPLGEPAVRDTRLKAHEVTGGVAPSQVRVRLHLEKVLQLA